ncbi:RNA polymerase sigma factor [Stenotrophomonas sp.]|jgi:RNA polymerase sigma-70 factor (ECF subfamily)|uniref:RNA polymerase sigma factor n=1 Tax=Stenotrophomonas sp. TaxID=69392 RepID=UPI00289F5CBB|nr:RNA polymerase sigma factor [Stenotrophomonas sp.]
MGATLAAERALWLAEHVLPYERGLRDWLRRRMAQAQDVDDVVQETYAILAALADVSHVRQPRAYVYQVAQSVVLQQLRRAQVVSMDMVADFDRLPITGEDASPERLASSRQELNKVTALIAQLPDKCRQAFVLRRVEGFSQREIAERMQISENTVEKHVCKGIRLLMESMKQDAGDAGSTGKPDNTEAVHARRR